jgi:hypothetical protein
VLLLFFIGVDAAVYRQSFDADSVANETNNATLSDGAVIGGSAVVNNSELVLHTAIDGQLGKLLLPPVNGSSLGWIVSFKLRFGALAPAANATPTNDAVRLIWGRLIWGDRSDNDSSLATAVGSWVVKTTGAEPGLLHSSGYHCTA